MMGVRLYTPDELVTIPLEGLDGVSMDCVAPSYATGRELMKFAVKVQYNPEEHLPKMPQMMKDHAGRIVKEVHGVELAGGETTIKIDIDDGKRIKDDCMVQLLPIVQDIFAGLMRFCHLAEKNAKN